MPAPLPRLRSVRLVAVAVLALGAAASPAQGSVLSRPNGAEVLLYQGLAYEENHVTISYAAASDTYTFRDTGTPGIITNQALGGCSVDPADPQVATCAARPDDQLLVWLADGDDVLQQSAPRDISVCGGEGDDVVSGGPGSDVIWGEEGDDTLSGGEAIDVLSGEEVCTGIGLGVTAPPGHDILIGGPGNDSLEGGRGIDEFDGGDGDDRLFGYAGADTLEGGAGSDFLSADDGDDVLLGGDGRDALCGGHGDDRESGGDGDDALGASLTSQRFACDDAGNDVLDAGPGDDELDAGPTTGFFLEHTELPLPGPTEAGNGGDRLIGGEGSDTLLYTGRLTAVSVTTNGVADDGAAGEHDDVGADIEQITGGAGDDTLIGGPAPDRLDGAGGADVLRGGGGGDTLLGGAVDAGADRMFGEGGRDTLQGGAGPDELDGGDDPDAVAGDGGDDQLRGAAGADALEGGPGSDRVAGGDGDDQVDGGDQRHVGADGGDSLAGGPGNDALAGGPGDDALAGGPGSDRLSGGEGDADVADYGDARSPVSVTFDGIADDGRANEHDDVGADVEGFRGGGEDDTVRGGALLDGGDGEDYLDGGADTDRLRGGAGGDTLRSRDGATDRVSCGSGRDLVVADRQDQIDSDCEVVEIGTPVARAGRRAVVRPLAGVVALAHTGALRSAPLLDRISVRLPARIDAARGTVEVVTARRGRRATARVSGASFSLHQRAGSRRPPGARLRRATDAACAGRPARTVLQRLRVRSAALLRTSGSAGTALGRGTWQTEERCDGTRFRILTGTARIRDHLTKRVVRLRAGDVYLARRP